MGLIFGQSLGVCMKTNFGKSLTLSVSLLAALMLGACATVSTEDHADAYVATEHRTGTNLRGRSNDGVKNMSQEEIDSMKSRAAVTGKGPSN
jgi:hypothetical protein